MDRGAYYNSKTSKYYIVDEGKILQVNDTQVVGNVPGGALDISKGAIPPGPEAPPEIPEEEKIPEEKTEEKEKELI